jgi:hypothetical protein
MYATELGPPGVAVPPPLVMDGMGTAVIATVAVGNTGGLLLTDAEATGGITEGLGGTTSGILEVAGLATMLIAGMGVLGCVGIFTVAADVALAWLGRGVAPLVEALAPGIATPILPVLLLSPDPAGLHAISRATPAPK